MDKSNGIKGFFGGVDALRINYASRPDLFFGYDNPSRAKRVWESYLPEIFRYDIEEEGIEHLRRFRSFFDLDLFLFRRVYREEIHHESFTSAKKVKIKIPPGGAMEDHDSDRSYDNMIERLEGN